MISKSIIFRPPQCFSPMIVFFLILGGLPSQMKLKIILLILSMRDLDTVSNELQYMSFDKPNVLTILILPIKVSFLLFQLLSVFSKPFLQLVKGVGLSLVIGKVYTRGIDLFLWPFKTKQLVFERPPTILTTTLLFVLLSRPLICLNLSKCFSNYVTESRSRTKTAVSSAY